MSGNNQQNNWEDKSGELLHENITINIFMITYSNTCVNKTKMTEMPIKKESKT